MSIPVTTTTPYCSRAQFIGWYDARTVGQLLTDNDFPIAPDSVASNPLLASFLLAASGKLETAAFRGGRYTPADLTKIAAGSSTPGDTAASAFLSQITAGICMGMLVRRRPDVAVPAIPQIQEAELFLGALEQGEVIFPIDTVIAAGVEDDFVEQEQDILNRNLTTTLAAPLFGKRGNRYSHPGATGSIS